MCCALFYALSPISTLCKIAALGQRCPARSSALLTPLRQGAGHRRMAGVPEPSKAKGLPDARKTKPETLCLYPAYGRKSKSPEEKSGHLPAPNQDHVDRPKTTKKKTKVGMHWLGPSRSSPPGFATKNLHPTGSIFYCKNLDRPAMQPVNRLSFFLFFLLGKCL